MDAKSIDNNFAAWQAPGYCIPIRDELHKLVFLLRLIGRLIEIPHPVVWLVLEICCWLHITDAELQT